MPEHLIAGGTIRKLSIGEAPLYCAHLLRLDPESRRNRFGGTVSDAYIRSYAQAANFADAVIHGFFVEGVLRGIAELRPLPGDDVAVESLKPRRTSRPRSQPLPPTARTPT